MCVSVILVSSTGMKLTVMNRNSHSDDIDVIRRPRHAGWIVDGGFAVGEGTCGVSIKDDLEVSCM